MKHTLTSWPWPFINFLTFKWCQNLHLLSCKVYKRSVQTRNLSSLSAFRCFRPHVDLSDFLQEAQLTQRDRASTLSVKILQNAAQMFDDLHLKTPKTGEWPSRSLKVIVNGTIWQAKLHFLLTVRRNNMAILHHFTCHFHGVRACRCLWEIFQFRYKSLN